MPAAESPGPPMRKTLTCLLLALAPAAFAADGALPTTRAERTGFAETGRYDEVVALCDAFARTWPNSVRCLDFGTTPQGRPMKALVASTAGALDPATAHERGLPVVLAQGGIHAGEIDGKDAGFLLLRDLLQGKAGAGVLDKAVLLFVPVFNVDGHENFRAWNRPNQRGPAEMGFRATAQRYNLNRDYLKADAPEMRAMLDLVLRWDPLVELDLHVTDGAKFRHDVSITGEPIHSGDEALREAGSALRDGMVAKLSAQGSLPLAFYPDFADFDDPASGFVDSVYPPRFSHGYFPLRNRIGILVETHSWKPYPQRVRTTYDAMLDALELTADNAARWQALARDADARATKLGGQPVALTYRTTGKARTIDFLGYAYTRTPSEISGALMTRYDESRPETWKVPLRDEIVPDLVVTAPKGGYLVPPEYAELVSSWLLRHGIGFRVLANSTAYVKVQAFVADKVEFGKTSMEGHQRADIGGHWQDDTVDIRAGSLYVPIAQPLSRLLVNLLEPQAPDSLAAWGEFNNCFERKEYMEAYVAEEQARLMLAREPKLKAEFEKELQDDPAFANDPRARLDFFYRRHPAWDAGYDRYPVLRTDIAY
jgi:hypothetical protein